MRTTLTLDDALALELKQLAAQTGKPFKQVVNETLRAGLQSRAPAARPYRLKPASLGRPALGVDLVHALRVAETLEDQAILAELELRK